MQVIKRFTLMLMQENFFEQFENVSVKFSIITLYGKWYSFYLEIIPLLLFGKHIFAVWKGGDWSFPEGTSCTDCLCHCGNLAR